MFWGSCRICVDHLKGFVVYRIPSRFIHRVSDRSLRDGKSREQISRARMAAPPDKVAKLALCAKQSTQFTRPIASHEEQFIGRVKLLPKSWTKFHLYISDHSLMQEKCYIASPCFPCSFMSHSFRPSLPHPQDGSPTGFVTCCNSSHVID